MSTEAQENAELAMELAIDAVRRRLGQIRTGKASPAILDGLLVEYYGTPTPLKQLATVAVPEPRLLAVKPFDRSVIGEIEKAIQSSNLGLNPASDGMMIRLQIPELTEEQLKRAIPARLRKRLMQGRFESGEDIAALRSFVGLTQAEFARAIEISVHTLRNWEQGRRKPEGPAIALLRIAARHPRIIRENLESAA